MKRKISYIKRDKTLPYIRLQGQWLKDIGFEIGDYFRLYKDHGKITLQLEKAISHR